MTVAGLNLSAQFAGKCGFHFPGPGVRGCLMKKGSGASRTWPEAPTPTLARIPLAQTRHSGCLGVGGGC